jgi:hypothetical protein
VDSDDWVAPDYLEKLLGGLTGTGADICECAILRTESEQAQAASGAMLPAKIYHTEEALYRLIHDDLFRQHVWNKLYRRNVIAEIYFPKGKTNEDEFWTYQAFGNAKKVSKIPDVLYFYFQRPGSIMGETYSLKRLDALDAKLARQKYVQQHFPDLTAIARYNLFGSCIYAGQMSLLHLSKEDLASARAKINTALCACPMTLTECISAPGSNKVWFSFARVSFWGTCRLKNLLKKGF